jgi:hypothetical protein
MNFKRIILTFLLLAAAAICFERAFGQTATSFGATVANISASTITLQGSVPGGNTISYQAAGFGCTGCAAPANGTILSLNAATGVLVYKPNVGYTGTDTLTFKVGATPTGGGSTTLSSVATLTITVTSAKTRVVDTLTDPNGAPLAGKVTFILTQPATGPSGLITASSSVSANLDSAGRFDIQVYPCTALSPQAFYQVYYYPAAGAARGELVGVFNIPASNTTVTLSPYRVTDTNLAARYTFADKASVDGLTSAVATQSLAAITGTTPNRITKIDANGKLADSPISDGAEAVTVSKKVVVAGDLQAQNYVGIQNSHLPPILSEKTISNSTLQNPAITGTVQGNATVQGTLTAQNLVGNCSGCTGLTGATGGVANAGSTTAGADTDVDGIGVLDLQTRNLTRARIENDGRLTLFSALGLYTTAKAALPASGVNGLIAKSSDGTRDLHINFGNYWYPINSGTVIVEAFGCRGDYQESVTGSINSGSTTLNAASGSPFTLEIVGRAVTVSGAGASGGNLSTTIAAFISPTQVTLANQALTTVSAQTVAFSAQTDNASCFDSIESYINSDKAHRVRFGSGRYRTSRGLVFNRPVTVEGNTAALNYNGEYTGTAIYFESGITGITLNPQAQGSRIENLHLISGNGGAGTNDGLRIRAHAVLAQNLVIYGFGQDGVNIDTSAGGNANNTTAINVRSQENWRHGFYWRGGDSQATSCITCDASINRGYGFYNYDSGHNAWFNIHSDGNGTGYTGALQNKADFFTNGSTLFAFGAYSEGGKWFVLGPSANAIEAITGTYAAPIFKAADCADGFTGCTFTDHNPARGHVRQGGGVLGNAIIFDRAGSGTGRYYTWQNFQNNFTLLSNAPGGTDTRTYIEAIHDASGHDGSYTSGGVFIHKPVVFPGNGSIGTLSGVYRPGTVYAATSFRGPLAIFEGSTSGNMNLRSPAAGLGGTVVLPNSASTLNLPALETANTFTQIQTFSAGIALDADTTWTKGAGAPSGGSCTSAKYGSLYSNKTSGKLYVCEDVSGTPTWVAK